MILSAVGAELWIRRYNLRNYFALSALCGIRVRIPGALPQAIAFCAFGADNRAVPITLFLSQVCHCLIKFIFAYRFC